MVLTNVIFSKYDFQMKKIKYAYVYITIFENNNLCRTSKVCGNIFKIKFSNDILLYIY